MKIVIIEKDQNVSNLMKSKMIAKSILSFNQPKDLLALLKKDKNKIDLVICESINNEMNDFVSLIKEHELIEEIILLSKRDDYCEVNLFESNKVKCFSDKDELAALFDHITSLRDVA